MNLEEQEEEKLNTCSDCGYEGAEGPGEGTCPECGGEMVAPKEGSEGSSLDEEGLGEEKTW